MRVTAHKVNSTGITLGRSQPIDGEDGNDAVLFNSMVDAYGRTE